MLGNNLDLSLDQPLLALLSKLRNKVTVASDHVAHWLLIIIAVRIIIPVIVLNIKETIL